MGRPMAIDSRILSRVPPPMRSGTMTDRRLGQVRADVVHQPGELAPAAPGRPALGATPEPMTLSLACGWLAESRGQMSRRKWSIPSWLGK